MIDSEFAVAEDTSRNANSNIDGTHRVGVLERIWQEGEKSCVYEDTLLETHCMTSRPKSKVVVVVQSSHSGQRSHELLLFARDGRC